MTGVEFAILVVLSRHDARDRREVEGVGSEELEVNLGLLELELHLVALLLRSRTVGEQAIQTCHLDAQVSDGQTGGLVLLLVHTYDGVAAAYAVAYLDVDMLYLTCD